MTVMKKNTIFTGVVASLLSLCACTGNKRPVAVADTADSTNIIVVTDTIAYRDESEEKLYHADVRYARCFRFTPQTDGIATRVMIRPGQQVAEGQPLIAYPVQNYQLQVEQHRTVYNDLLVKLEKQKALLSKGFVAQQTVDDLELEAANKAKELKRIEEQYVVKAPFSGTVTDVAVREGDHVAAGTQLFVLAQTDCLTAEFFASQEDVRQIEEGSRVELEAGGLPVLPGKVTCKSLIMDDERRAYRIQAEFPNRQGAGLGGVTAKVRIKLAGEGRVIRVPLQAVASVGGEDIIYKSVAGRAVATPVRIVRIVGQQAVVDGNLHPGEIYVIQGAEKLTDQVILKTVGV